MAGDAVSIINDNAGVVAAPFSFLVKHKQVTVTNRHATQVLTVRVFTGATIAQALAKAIATPAAIGADDCFTINPAQSALVAKSNKRTYFTLSVIASGAATTFAASGEEIGAATSLEGGTPGPPGPPGAGTVLPGFFDLADYSPVGDGIADDSVPIRNWCLAAAAYASPTTPAIMYAGPGTYKTTLAGRTLTGYWAGSSGVIGTVPSNVYMYGVEQQTWFYQTGVPASGSDGGGAVDLASYQVFGVVDGSSNIIFEHLAFRGENNPYVYVSNNQASCIAVVLISTHDVLVQNCRFRDLYGFSVHDPGEDEDVHVKDCWFYQCANGLNVNANGTIQTGNFMDTCEGIECSGARALIADNVIINAQSVGISTGGASDPRYGVVVSGNVIDGCDGSAIRVGDGNYGAVIDGNVVRKAKFQGISFGAAWPGSEPRNCVISNNTFIDCGLISAGAGVGMEISYDNHVVTGNMCYNTGDDVLYAQQYGCIIRGDNVFLDGNYLDGSVRDLDIPNTAANLRLGQNFYKNNTVYWAAAGTSSLATDAGWFKAATDKVREYRVTGGSVAEPYSNFAEWVDGKHEWGAGGGTARDTNLYRSAADTLKTDDRFKTGASTTGSRPSAATAGDGAEWYDTTLKRRITSDGTNWQAYIAATGPSTGWAVSNVTTDKVFDANATSIDEIADALGTLITYLISIGILSA